jgi:pimeloyl-ACP methyl ester carboxylesterase
MTPTHRREKTVPDYSTLDRSSAIHYVFYPRRDFTRCPENAFDVSVPVGGTVSIVCRFYPGRKDRPWVLFFHGNGEVASDYNSIAPFYHQKRLNLAVADYRGYGQSGGVPNFTDLVRDAGTIFERTQEELITRGFSKDLWVMGRSLGSISALELAHRYPDRIRGLVIESGFCSVVRIMTHLGIPSPGVDLKKIDQECVEMIRKISVPALVMHGERDTLVPVQEARDLYQNLGSKRKQLLIIPAATHNDIMIVGFKKYFDTLAQFIETPRGSDPSGFTDAPTG